MTADTTGLNQNFGKHLIGNDQLQTSIIVFTLPMDSNMEPFHERSPGKLDEMILQIYMISNLVLTLLLIGFRNLFAISKGI